MDGAQLIGGLWWPKGIKPTAPAHALRHVQDIREALRLTASFAATSIAIQAGGNVGLWPLAMAQQFLEVHTFEPEAETFRFLTANTAEHRNIRRHALALGDVPGRVSVKARSLGSHHVVDGDAVEVVTIDHLFADQPHRIGLIQLDVEGYELPALRGAKQVLAKWRPVLQLETRGLGDRYAYTEADLSGFLRSFGYTEARKVGSDTLYRHKAAQ